MQINDNEKLLSLRKSKKVLRQVYSLYKRKRKSLIEIQKKRLENSLLSLQTALLSKNKVTADRAAKNLMSLASQHLQKGVIDHIIDVAGSLAFALVLAVVIRQIWFEFYTIPTGSMRPTFKENDFIVVAKNDFCLNIPLTTKHFYFDDTLLNRGGTVIFTGANIDIHDVNMMYFYIFPGKKQLIKRLIAKPGDTLYFYGGQIYGIDEKEQPIKDFQTASCLKLIEHIPFIRFEGKNSNVFQRVYSDITANIVQMNSSVAKLTMNDFGQIRGEILPAGIISNPKMIKDYYQLFGYQNFAMARMLSKQQVKDFYPDQLSKIDDASYYLELKHHPSIANAQITTNEFNNFHLSLGYDTSLIPITPAIAKILFKALYTARFIIENEIARPYGSSQKMSAHYPHLNLPNGAYEIQDGKAFQVLFGGILKKLPADHPIYDFSMERLQFFYNLGIEFSSYFQPKKASQMLVPSRYIYFRNNELYTMGHPVVTKDDPALASFLQKEYQKQSLNPNYHPFEDLGPPVNHNGIIDVSIIKKYGMKIPENMYLVLGDNYAQSADSRDFGFVPQSNLRGGAGFIFWPPGNRIGFPNQPPYAIFSFPKIVTWSLFLICTFVSFVYYQRKWKKPLKF